MTDDELRALLAGATPGPWAAIWRPNIRNYALQLGPGDVDCMAHHEQRNARLIAAAPELAAEVLRLRRVLAVERGAIEAADAALSEEGT